MGEWSRVAPRHGAPATDGRDDRCPDDGDGDAPGGEYLEWGAGERQRAVRLVMVRGRGVGPGVDRDGHRNGLAVLLHACPLLFRHVPPCPPGLHSAPAEAARIVISGGWACAQRAEWPLA